MHKTISKVIALLEGSYHTMVSKVDEAKKRNRVQKWQKEIECNKGKKSKFKRSSSNMEEDGASSAILLLVCIAFCAFQPSNNACPR
ncbi:hypothetical protein PHAVU_009G168600 [Phaseolus vulgaris]|uniref:Uncharacterized protein n=1 Tax=Phaseolus vulgaris TaxID=3885 RepID=V7AZA6_PHAVU|nr:hypothetical protein PHAVU_009G168600g [Phaseolus vulgaris]ESW09943.1 hypothetical protein PHAVU_009G168600g [Phaseolus vulgaris]